MSIPTDTGGQGFQIPIQIPDDAQVVYDVRETVVTDKSKLGVRVGDVLVTTDDTGVQTYHITINVNVLASAPQPPAGKEASLAEIAGNPNISGPNGLGNPWFSGSPAIAFVENFFAMLAALREQGLAEGKFEVESMAASVEMALTSSDLIKLSGSKEAAMQIMSAVMGAASIASGAIKLGGMTDGFRKAMANRNDVVGEKFKMWDEQATSAQHALKQAKIDQKPLLEDKKNAQAKLDALEYQDGNKVLTHGELKKSITKNQEELSTLEERKAVADAELKNNPTNAQAKAELDKLNPKNQANYDQLKTDRRNAVKLRDEAQSKLDKANTQLDKANNDLKNAKTADERDTAQANKEKAENDQKTSKEEVDKQTKIVKDKNEEMKGMGEIASKEAELFENQQYIQALEKTHPDYKTLSKDFKDAKKAFEKNEDRIANAKRTLLDVDGKVGTFVESMTSMIDGGFRAAEGLIKAGLTITKAEADAMKHMLDSLREVRRQQIESAGRGQKEASDTFNTVVQNLTQMISKNYQSFSVTYR